MATTDVVLMSTEEFLRLYEVEGPFELIDGERIPIVAQATRSSRIARRILVPLSVYLETHPLGEVFVETSFVLTPPKKRNWVKGSRKPDVMFINAQRIAELNVEYPDWEEGPVIAIPDLVVEVVSPTDTFDDVDKKIARYLQDGVRIIWLVKPETKTVTIHRLGSKQQTTLGLEDTLSGEDIIPGFEVVVSKLFS